MKTELKNVTELGELIETDNTKAIWDYIDYLHMTIRQFDCTCSAIVNQLTTNYREVKP